MDRLLRAQRYLEAGNLALKHDHNAEAIDYFIRAQRPTRAAQVALRIGDARRAAELYERAGDVTRAARCYETAGLSQKSRDLLAVAEGEGAADPLATSQDVGVFAGTGSLGSREDADTKLAMGDIRGAADAYRAAGFDDEAIHLYVNVLALPGEAAPMVEARGNVERAAELYEMAGEPERAADIWMELAAKSDEPDTYISRLRELSPDRAHTFLEQQTSVRPLSDRTVELHYSFAISLADRGERGPAIEIMVRIQTEVGDYKDLRTNLATWQESPGGAGSTNVEAPSSQGERAPQIIIEGPVVIDQTGALTGPAMATLEPEEVQAITLEAARAAVKHTHVLRLTTDDLVVVDDTVLREPGSVAVNIALDRAPIPELLADSAVQAAKEGPSLSTLLAYVDGNGCDLQNIEVFYRAGLAYLAAGCYEEAESAFRKVEEVSPGYRDALPRADAIDQWQTQLAGQVTNLGVKGRALRHATPSRYTVQGELGRGGMAVVYRARDEVLGRDVALKFLSDEFTTNQEVRDMFQREARSVAQLNQPNVVTIYDFGTLEGRAFIAMEYVEGVTLKDLIRKGQMMSVVESLRIIVQLLDALAYAHERKIIHRDIKPSNVMRSTDGIIKLMDFGLAKSVQNDNQQSIIAGTPAYMAPEQILGEKIDGRADLFSVGVTLYEMLASKLPFKALDRSPPTPLRMLNPTVPRFLEQLVMRSIHIDEAQRFQTADSFRAPIRTIITAVGDRATGDVKTGDLPSLDILPMQGQQPNVMPATPAQDPQTEREGIDATKVLGPKR